MPHQAEASRYDAMHYRRCGKSGLQLPALSPGLWHNVGDGDNLAFAEAELAEIDRHAPKDAAINLWAISSRQ
ncbi:aryl-alcohol dehydrogenase-like predicted oxidoreductase [Halomonas campaniensis]|uniref:Aryl-alcohol dehydrogenase-like predicted oxidoreductase n=1 Tax=Halomonas campaniensis TaxID=213554 RepID=A0A7W5K0F6_9GAMM|nr:hypothetical protein [Halomonas campaniensis]MBB3329516.1 aryl-alcohol dehydrogenase-like predicted oxidoreductase [Halomonas campaniensis]